MVTLALLHVKISNVCFQKRKKKKKKKRRERDIIEKWLNFWTLKSYVLYFLEKYLAK